jgi:hypothetical protein
MTALAIGIEGLVIFKDMSVYEIIIQILFKVIAYAAAASFVYKNYKLVKEKVIQEKNNE